MRRLGRFVLFSLAIIGLVTLMSVGLGVWALARISHKVEPALPERMVLSMDLEGRFHEAASSDPFARLTGEKVYELRKVVEAIDRAGADKRVAGLFATLGHAQLGMAQVQELRDAVSRFRASGKPAVLFAETIGEGGNGTLETYLASSFGQVWLQPSGEVGLTGFMAESPFLKGTLEMLGVEPQFGGRYEYKSAIEIFTEKGFSGPHAENLGQLLDSMIAQVVDGLSLGRRLQPDAVRALVAKGPFVASEALAAGLVDKLGYRDEAYKQVAGTEAKDTDEVDVADYAVAEVAARKGTKVALITGSGAIHRGESDTPLGSDGQDFGAATVAQAFRDAIDDADVKAILFRVDSPGGSYTASDTVWHEVERARAAGKKVVASMGNVAASGGYFVAMGADRVVAAPGTITGSIGVFSGKFVMAELWKKLGVSWDELHRGDNAGMWSANRPFSEAGWARLNAMLDQVYQDFTGKAGKARNITPEAMDKVARGRVWTGADAKALGLVDELGGWSAALAETRKALALEPGAPLDLVTFPEPQSPVEVLAKLLAAGGRVAEGNAASIRVLAPLLRQFDRAQAPGVQLTAPLAVERGLR